MSWEFSKENIQPLAKGRKMSNLQAALKTQPKEILAAKRHEFEVEIRTYDGDDPLDVWYRYITWVQQSYPSGGKESGLMELCKKAVYNYYGEIKYRNDERFIQMWIIYANFSHNSLELFKLMQEHHIGTSVAMFYKAWAWAVECLGNSRKADAILTEGIVKKAQPLDELISYHQKFQERMVKMSCESADDVVFTGSEAQRKALCELKTVGKSSKAPINRVGTSVLQTSAQPVSRIDVKHSSSYTKKTEIFVDENNDICDLNQTSKSGRKITALPGSSEISKENTKNPGPWNKARLKTKTKTPLPDFTTSVASQSQSFAPSVQIYVEEENKQKKPAKAQPTFTTVLRNIKDCKPAAFVFEPFDPTKIPMYDKWRVYGGPEEMSFEELRALRIAEKLKKLNIEALSERVKVMEQKLYEKDQLIEKLEENSSGFKDMEKMCDSMKNVVVCDTYTREKVKEIVPYPQSIPATDSITSQLKNFQETMDVDDESHLHTASDKASSHLMNEKVQSGSQNSKVQSKSELDVQKYSLISLPNATETETVSASSTEMSMIRELWNGSIGENFGQSCADDDLTYFKETPLAVSNPNNGEPRSKITIYTDDDKADPNCVYNDDDDNKENCPPCETQPPKIKRNITGILQPSIDYPMTEPETPDYNQQADDNEPMQHDGYLTDNDARNCLSMSQITPSSGLILTETYPSTVALSSTRLEPPERLLATEHSKQIDLSVIMEASHEYSSKSSLSSNSSSGQISNSASRNYFANNTVLKDPSFCAIHEDTVSKFNITSNETTCQLNDHIDPFEEDCISNLLTAVKPPLTLRPGYHRIKEEISLNFKILHTDIGGSVFNIKKMIAEGSYAKVYFAKNTIKDSDKECVLKVQKPACYWEFYISDEINNRLQGCVNQKNVLSSFASIDDAYFYNNGSVLSMGYCPFGTLLDLNNLYCKVVNCTMPIELSIFLTIQILYILENLHSCNIIHGDIKPDNILISSIPSPEDVTPDMFGNDRKLNLKLIDFGRSIDMNILPSGSTFTKVVKTDNFTCTEMLENKLWTYQTDLFGCLVTIHVLLFNCYMDVSYKNGQWNMNKKLKRYWLGAEIMEEMFTSLLNIPDCENIPDIKTFRLRLEEILNVKMNMRKLQVCLVSLQKLFS